MDGSTAKCLQNLGLEVLQYTLVRNGYASKRKFRSVEAFKSYFFKHTTIIIDATEQRTQRPGDIDYQKLMYSGKKSPHRQVHDYHNP